MTAFDPERYLRLLGERTLLDGGSGDHHWSSPLAEAGDCLVVVGSITLECAQRIVDDYQLAKAVRNQGHSRHFLRRHHRWAPPTPPADEKPPRVIPCDRELVTNHGSTQIHHVSLSESQTSIAVTFRPAASSIRRHRGGRVMMGSGGHVGHAGPPTLSVKDDHGKTTSTNFSGGGSDEEWEGYFEAHDPLSPETKWIEIDGERIDLDKEAPPAHVLVKPVEASNPGLRHLWHRLATGEDRFHRPPDTLDVGIDALIACGALDPDSGEIAGLRAVTEALQGGRGMGSASSAKLPEPWHSLLNARRKHPGAVGRISLAVLTPSFDGVSIVASHLEASEDDFGIAVQVRGAGVAHVPFGDTQLGQRSVAWWARDDVGNDYLGGMGSWSGSEHGIRGTVQFDAPLDPRATWLEFIPTTERERAVIRIALDWPTNTGEEQTR